MRKARPRCFQAAKLYYISPQIAADSFNGHVLYAHEYESHKINPDVADKMAQDLVLHFKARGRDICGANVVIDCIPSEVASYVKRLRRHAELARKKQAVIA